MKSKITALMLCFMSISMFGQEIKIISNDFPLYQGIVTTTCSTNEIYTSSKMWIAENFKSANDVIQLDDKDNAILVCKGITTYGSGFGEYRIHFIFKIEGKDNRFRYTITITDIRAGLHDVSGMSMFKPGSKNVIKFDTENMRPKIQSWIRGILSVQTISTNDDW